MLHCSLSVEMGFAWCVLACSGFCQMLVRSGYYFSRSDVGTFGLLALQLGAPITGGLRLYHFNFKKSFFIF